MDNRIELVPLPPPRGGPTALSVLVAITAIVAVAILKPWGSPAEAPQRSERPRATATAAALAPTTAPTPDMARQRVRALCLEPSGWRLYATERWSDRGVRSWKSIDPIIAADGPADPLIPFYPEASRAVLTLGYCAPIAGPERPPDGATTTIYRHAAQAKGGGGGDDTWEVIDPPRVEPPDGGSPLGGAWAPPPPDDRVDPAPSAEADEASAGWSSGTYVFRISGPAPGGDFSRWFGAVVEISGATAPAVPGTPQR